MNKFILSLSLTSLIIAIFGCAAKPEAIPPSYVSHIGYMDFDCKQLGAEQQRLIAALSTASDAQRQEDPMTQLESFSLVCLYHHFPVLTKLLTLVDLKVN